MATTQRSVRVSDELWQKLGELAARHGVSRSLMIVSMIVEAIEEQQTEGSTKA